MAGSAHFARVPPELDFPKEEREILRFWKERGIFEKTLERSRHRAARSSSTRARRRPTACRTTGTSSRASSRTSSPATRRCAATSVPRKAGWDTHGLPVEVEVEKELRIHGKAAIEEYGVEPFIAEVHRVGLPLHRASGRSSPSASASGSICDDAYVTYHQSYVESVWWALARALQEGPALPGAQGRLVVGAGRHGAQRGRGRAGVQAGRRSERLRRVSRSSDEPENRRSSSWTTTPWTLPSNMYAAVKPDVRLRRRRTPGTASASSSRRRSSRRSRRSSARSSRSSAR